MFDDNDSLLMDYADGAGGWNRVKTKTPIHVVKASRSVRIRCQPDKMAKKIARRKPLPLHALLSLARTKLVPPCERRELRLEPC